MFFRRIIPNARHWRVDAVGQLPVLSSASAVQWVRLVVVVRWKMSKAFMFVFLFLS